MKLQKLYALITFITLITTLSAHAMEQDHHDMHPLLCLPQEIQQQIVFPSGSTVIQVTEDNADELVKQIKTFFRFKRVSRYCNENLKFPWIGINLEIKNRMMQEVNVLMMRCSLQECTEAISCNVYFHDHSEEVSSGYKKYRVIPLALVLSGAGADITDKTASTTCLSKAVHAKDELAVEFLLNHTADPYQLAFDEDKLAGIMLDGDYQISYDDATVPICFYATTVPIVKLLLEKIDRQTLLNMPASNWIIGAFRHKHYPLEVMNTWLKYGISPRYIWNDNSSVLHTFIADHYQQNRWEFSRCDIFLKKMEALLELIYDMVNTTTDRGRTPMDFAENYMLSSEVKIDDHQKLIALLRKYGGKTSQKLEAEKLATEREAL